MFLDVSMKILCYYVSGGLKRPGLLVFFMMNHGFLYLTYIMESIK